MGSPDVEVWDLGVFLNVYVFYLQNSWSPSVSDIDHICSNSYALEFAASEVQAATPGLMGSKALSKGLGPWMLLLLYWHIALATSQLSDFHCHQIIIVSQREVPDRLLVS